MKKIKLFPCLLLVICLVICPNLKAGQLKDHSLLIEEPSFDVGEVEEGTLIEHSFRFKNEGDTLLDIKRVKPD